MFEWANSVTILKRREESRLDDISPPTVAEWLSVAYFISFVHTAAYFSLVYFGVLILLRYFWKMPSNAVSEDRQKWALSPIAKKPKNKPRTKQPKKVKFVATEIRCKEESKGGLKFDVIIADPAATPPKRPASPPTKTSAEEIEEKLKAAEERRLSLEANKMAKFAAKLSKIEEASKKKDEQNSVFINQTKEALEQKMETHIEKREAYLTDIKAKLKDHEKRAEIVRQNKERLSQVEPEITSSA
ncbi:stathmin isoform X7 [Rhodnius prolixus]|uniref:stathmin isoform X7 n=1 Tax=Rhodnius prolixus TaxID=13249 RepID=UPI003D18A397